MVKLKGLLFYLLWPEIKHKERHKFLEFLSQSKRRLSVSYPKRKRFIFFFPGHGFFHLRYFENGSLELWYPSQARLSRDSYDFLLYIIPWSKKIKIGVTLADVFSPVCVCAAILYFPIKRELTGIQIVKYICHVTWEKHFPFRLFYYRTKEKTPSAYPYIRTCGNYRIPYSVFSTSKTFSLKYILHQTVIISALKITISR